MATVRLDDDVNEALKKAAADRPGDSGTKIVNRVMRRALGLVKDEPAPKTKRAPAAAPQPAKRVEEVPAGQCPPHPPSRMIGDYCAQCGTTTKQRDK